MVGEITDIKILNCYNNNNNNNKKLTIAPPGKNNPKIFIFRWQAIIKLANRINGEKNNWIQ